MGSMSLENNQKKENEAEKAEAREYIDFFNEDQDQDDNMKISPDTKQHLDYINFEYPFLSDEKKKLKHVLKKKKE